LLPRGHTVGKMLPLTPFRGAEAILACLSAVAQTSPVAADDIEQGKPEYHRNCASCHGNDGRGTGPCGLPGDRARRREEAVRPQP